MQFGTAVGTACATFAITNVDDLFVLVTFFAEASTNKTLTPGEITLGQYVGFTVIVAISLIGFAVAQVLPTEPIGFLGLVPILLGVWKAFDLVYTDPEGENSETSQYAGAKSILKVAGITIVNGGDNIGTYVPLFSQAKGATIAVYVVVYYILLGVWCLAAFLVMRQKHILKVFQKMAGWLIPLLFIGLGIFIVVKSDCFPWSVDRINNQFYGNPGATIMGIMATFFILSCIGILFWIKERKRRARLASGDDVPPVELATGVGQVLSENAPQNSLDDARTTQEAAKADDEIRPCSTSGQALNRPPSAPVESSTARTVDSIDVANSNS